MADTPHSTAHILAEHRAEIVQRWVEAQVTDRRIRPDLLHPEEVRQQVQEVLEALVTATATGNLEDIHAPAYTAVKERLARLASQREHWGCTPFEIAAAIICLKDVWGPLLQVIYQDTPDVLSREIVVVSKLVDTLGLVTLESVVNRREQIIDQQAQAILELSTPVVQAWEGVIVAPLIGTLDTQRAAQFTERLLARIVDTQASVALVDITGVPAVDTHTAQHLVEAITAVRLLGAQVVVTGMRPAIAQALVHLGINLAQVVTRSSLQAGLRFALERLNFEVIRKDGRQSSS